MTWRGTLLLLLAGFLAAALLLITLRTRNRPADAPLLGITPGETTVLEISGGGSVTSLENRDGVWWITRPLLDRADPARMAGILGASASVVPKDRLRPSDLKGTLSLESLDLKPPKRFLTFRGMGTHTLRFGAEGAAPDSVYAQVDADPSVYLVSQEAAALSFRPLSELRDPRPFMVQAGQLSEIGLQQQGGYRELTLRKKGRDWTIITPLRTRADGSAAESWIASVLGSRILRWMPSETEASACGLETPEAVLSVCEQGGEPVRLELGKAVPETPGARYARCPGRPGIFVLGGTDSWLAVIPDALRLRHPSPVELDSVDRITLGTRNQTATLSRKPGTENWLCGDRTIPGAAVTDWCSRLQRLTASRFEAATPDHLAARGIEPATTATVKIRFVAHLSENSAEESAGEMILAEETIGTAAADGTTALRQAHADDLMILPSAEIRPLLDEALGWTMPSSAPSPVFPSTPQSSPSAQ